MSKSVTVFGLFASGLAAAYVASLISGKVYSRLSLCATSLGSLSIPKILPAIPDFEKEQISIDVEKHLGYNE